MSAAQRSGATQVTYADAGVDTTEGARAVDAIKPMVAATNRPEVIGGIGGFGGLFSAATFKDMDDPVLISGTDGVGTKLFVAQLLERHDTVGQDLVAMCVNDILASGAEPLFFLDYLAVGHLEADHVAKVVKGVADGCQLAGAVGVVERAQMLDPANVRPGDAIIGLPSTGFHANGYSLVRRVLGLDGVALGTAAAHERRSELERPLDELAGSSFADELMRPTRIYVKPVLEVLRSGAPVHALAHVTGGGISENLNRALAPDVDAVVDRNVVQGQADEPGATCAFPWDVPPVIAEVCRRARLSPNEACRTFNMGVGLCVLCATADEPAVRAALEAVGEHPFHLGSCVTGTGKVRYADEVECAL